MHNEEPANDVGEFGFTPTKGRISAAGMVSNQPMALCFHASLKPSHNAAKKHETNYPDNRGHIVGGRSLRLSGGCERNLGKILRQMPWSRWQR
jgi:hypothetical protein